MEGTRTSDTPLLTLARKRLDGWLDEVAESDPRLLQPIIDDPDAATGLARLLNSLAATRLGDANPLAAHYARGAEALKQQIVDTGGSLSEEEVAALLQIQPASVAKRRLRGALLGLSVGSSTVYPAAQFGGNAPLPRLRETLALLKNVSALEAFGILTKRRAELGDRSIFECLRGLKAGDVDIINDILAECTAPHA